MWWRDSWICSGGRRRRRGRVRLAPGPVFALGLGRLEGRHLDVTRALAGAGNVKTALHAQQSIHGNTEGFFDPDRHFGRKGSAFIQQRGKRGARDAEHLGRFRDGKPVGVNYFMLDEAAGMGGVFQADGLSAGHNVMDQRGKP